MTDRRTHLSVAEAAEYAGMSVWRMRRWLQVRSTTEPNLLTHFAPPGKSVGKWWVSRQTLGKILDSDSVDQVDVLKILDRQGKKIVQLERRLSVLERSCST